MVQTILVKRRAGSGAPVGGTFGEISYSATDNIFRVYDGTVWQGFASLDSPAFTGTPTAPTAAPGTNTTQIATTAFVQDAVAGSVESIDWKESVELTSDANTNWTTTATANYVTGTGILTISNLTAGVSRGLIDGVEPVDNDRILLKDVQSLLTVTTDGGAEGTPAKYNCLWEVTGGTASSLTLQRTSDANTDAKVTNGLTIASTNAGSVNTNKRFILTTADPITLNTTALIFSELTNTSFTAGDGIDITAGTISVVVADFAGTGLEDDGSNNLRVKADITTGATVAPVSVTANGVGVSVDNTSIIHTGGTLEVEIVDGGTY